MPIKISILFFLFATCNDKAAINVNLEAAQRTAYYFSNDGNDNNDGSINNPFKTIAHLNKLHYNAGDTIFLKANEVFTGSINLGIHNSPEKNLVLTSYGSGNAVINAADSSAIIINQSSYISIKNIVCKGSGRKNGNTTNGIELNSCSNIKIENVDVSGFQKAGLLIHSSSYINANKVVAHDNGFAGISVLGLNKKDDCSNIHISNCTATNNAGDPTNLNNHSGNGIIAGFCKNVLIEYCTASNNGWDMPRIGNGPVGIWCYEADSITIQHCISYENKTSKGGEDGGGYDFDGGTTNSVIQYCLSYNNYGSAFGIFQYAGASSWQNNVIRFCISENDGKVSAAHAGAYVWNNAHDSSQFKNFLFYNNTIYNDSNAAISYSVESAHSNFVFYNNIFLAADEIIRGNYNADVFIGNDWWSLKNKFNVNNNYDFTKWCIANNKEQLNGTIKGINTIPPFKNAGKTMLTNANELLAFDNYKIINASPVSHFGLDLQSLFNTDIGDEDFNGNTVNKNCMGACTGK